MPTIAQIRAARALIGWSQGELAEQADMSQTGIARIENGTNNPNSATLEKIRAAFDKADVEFIGGSGVKKRSGEVKKFSGTTGLIQFMDDVYNCARHDGGKMYFYNIVPENWLVSLGQDWWDYHANRMSQHNKKTDIRILIPEGNTNFISSKYAKYKWFPQKFGLSLQKSLYAYGDKLGFVTFDKNVEKIEVITLHNSDFADGMRAMFEISWDEVAKEPH